MTDELKTITPDIISSLVINGDLSKLNPMQKVELYNYRCHQAGLDPSAKPFDRQPIMEIARMVGLPYHTRQIQKKVQEATSMAARGDKDAAKAELLGAINYAAAAWLFLTEQQAAEEDEGDSL